MEYQSLVEQFDVDLIDDNNEPLLQTIGVDGKRYVIVRGPTERFSVRVRVKTKLPPECLPHIFAAISVDVGGMEYTHHRYFSAQKGDSMREFEEVFMGHSHRIDDKKIVYPFIFQRQVLNGSGRKRKSVAQFSFIKVFMRFGKYVVGEMREMTRKTPPLPPKPILNVSVRKDEKFYNVPHIAAVVRAEDPLVMKYERKPDYHYCRNGDVSTLKLAARVHLFPEFLNILRLRRILDEEDPQHSKLLALLNEDEDEDESDWLGAKKEKRKREAEKEREVLGIPPKVVIKEGGVRTVHVAACDLTDDAQKWSVKQRRVSIAEVALNDPVDIASYDDEEDDDEDEGHQ